MKVDQHEGLIDNAIETAEPGLNDKIYNHKFREDRNRKKDVSPEKFVSGNAKNASDRLKRA